MDKLQLLDRFGGSFDENGAYFGLYNLADDGETPVPVKSAEERREWDAKGRDKRRVAWTELPHFEVSTVFLAHDHNYGPGRTPVLWETMVFIKGTHRHVHCDRYTSAADARVGHDEAVAAWRGAPEHEETEAARKMAKSFADGTWRKDLGMDATAP